MINQQKGIVIIMFGKKRENTNTKDREDSFGAILDTVNFLLRKHKNFAYEEEQTDEISHMKGSIQEIQEVFDESLVAFSEIRGATENITKIASQTNLLAGQINTTMVQVETREHKLLESFDSMNQLVDNNVESAKDI